MKVRFLSAAETEMFEAAVYYEMQVKHLGGDFLGIIEEAIDEIIEMPTTWPEIESGIRKRIIRRFPYSILYALNGNEVVIVAIMHQKQKPRYWIERYL